MKSLISLCALSLLFICEAHAEQPTLCIGDEVQGSFGQGLSITINADTGEADIRHLHLYGYHVRTNEVLAHTEKLDVSQGEDGSLKMANDDLRITLNSQQNGRWEGFASSHVEEVGLNHPITCSVGDLVGNVGRYLH